MGRARVKSSTMQLPPLTESSEIVIGKLTETGPANEYLTVSGVHQTTTTAWIRERQRYHLAVPRSHLGTAEKCC